MEVLLVEERVGGLQLARLKRKLRRLVAAVSSMLGLSGKHDQRFDILFVKIQISAD